MIEKLIKIADELDSLGLHDKSNSIDEILEKMAESGMHTVPTYVADDQDNEITAEEVMEAIIELSSKERKAILSWLLEIELSDDEEESEEDSEEEDSEEEDEEDLFEFDDEDEDDSDDEAVG